MTRTIRSGALLLGLTVSACATESPAADAGTDVAQVSQALEGVEGMMDVAIDAPWRIEPVQENGFKKYGQIPVQIAIHDANQVGADSAPSHDDAGVPMPLVPTIGKFCSLRVTLDGQVTQLAFGQLAEVEATFGSWAFPVPTSAPDNLICKFWQGDDPLGHCAILRAINGTSEWHGLAWLDVPAGADPGDDLQLRFDLKLARDVAGDCTSSAPEEVVVYTNHASVHLGDDALPRFSEEWLYGDLHYHSQGTDNEGESGYAHRNVVRAMGAMGIDFALASEHASDSEQTVDADINVDVSLSVGTSVNVVPDITAALHGGVLRDMSAKRFETLHARMNGAGGVNAEAALATSRREWLPQGARSHGIVPQLFLGGEVDVIPETREPEHDSIPYGLGTQRYPLVELCKGGLGLLPCTLANITSDRAPDDGSILLRDAQGVASETSFYGTQHLLYFPEGKSASAFVGSRTSKYGGATRRLGNVLEDARAKGGAMFIAHPDAFPQGYVRGLPRLDGNGYDYNFTYAGGPGPNSPPWSTHQFRTAFRDSAVLGIEFWNEDTRLRTRDAQGTDFWGWERPDLQGCLFGLFCGGGEDMCKVGETSLDATCSQPPDLRVSVAGWSTGRFGFEPWDLTTRNWTRPSAFLTPELSRGEASWDRWNLVGLNPKETDDLDWLPEGDPRRLFIAGGSDAHGDWNYRREGYLIGLDGITDTAIAKPRNLVFVPPKPKDLTDRISEDLNSPRAPRQADVLSALQTGNFSTTDGPALRMVIDENRNGQIDAGDQPMGGITHLYGETNIPVLVEWKSTHEFGALSSIELTVGMFDTDTNVGRVYRGGLGVQGYAGPTALTGPSEVRGGLTYTHLGGDIWVGQAPAYSATQESKTALRIVLPESAAEPTLWSGVRAFTIDLNVLRAAGVAVADNIFIRAFAVTRQADPSCTNPLHNCNRRGGAIRRFAYTNPIWAVTRTAEGCPVDPSAIDEDVDGIPDGCDPCLRDDAVCVPPVPGGDTIGPTSITCYADADHDGFAAGTAAAQTLTSTNTGNCPYGYTASSPGATPDCAPNDGFVFPGAREWCDPAFTDHNCNPSDEGFVMCYRDADGDGFGSGPLVAVCPQSEFPGCPPFYSDRLGDCCDSDARARPGQNQSFETPRTSCGGYDFDCNNSETRTYVRASGSCSAATKIACVAANRRFRAGFQATTACGVTGEYLASCYWDTLERDCFLSEQSKRQSCR